MTSINQLRKDLETVRRAIAPKETYDDGKLIGEYMRWFEKATEGMSQEEKSRFDHEIAKQVAKEYAEGRI